ncbi:hypothetical protein [Holdemania massiliensis]|uniref:hypothetical protein n=1 Tax=Holdemania massiliensis TaxID=1468449 RepID=UPI001F066A32|nr:hypothetical protein [Holdemania massiliensis]MCH1942395.1 hypothetical protein [Holdemania massiliensis]
MKHINKILCLAMLFLGIVTGCSQNVDSQPQSSLKPAAYNQEDTAIAKQFGYTADPQIFQFAADTAIQSLHYTVYKLNQGQWEVQWTADQTLSGARGRIAVYSDALPSGYTIIMQCDNICVKDQLQVDNPDFTLPEEAAFSHTSLNKEIPLEFTQEIPVLLQQISTDKQHNSVELDQFFNPGTFSDQDEVWALTLTFQASKASRQLPA